MNLGTQRRLEGQGNSNSGWWLKNHWEGLFFISMCCKGVFARSCTVAWMLLCTEEGSAVVIWLDHIFLNKIIRNQVLELSGKLLSWRHWEGALNKICYRLCNGPVEAHGVDFAPSRLEGPVCFVTC